MAGPSLSRRHLSRIVRNAIFGAADVSMRAVQSEAAALGVAPCHLTAALCGMRPFSDALAAAIEQRHGYPADQLLRQQADTDAHLRRAREQEHARREARAHGP